MAGQCEHCGADMVLRTARYGPRAGKQFWGCSRWRKGEEHSTWNVEGDDESLTDAAHPPSPVSAKAPLTHVAVAWTDEADDRNGWLSQYSAAGARLRCLPNELLSALEVDLGTCWIAASDVDSYEPADADTQRVLAMALKILQRGRTAPVDPRVEELLLQHAEKAVSPPAAGTLIPVLAEPLDARDLETCFNYARQAPIDPTIPFDSAYERDAFHVLAERIGDARRLSVQAPLDTLAQSRGIDSGGARRADFLLTGHKGFDVIEIDGPQHLDDGADQDRDDLVALLGGTTQRVSTQDVLDGRLADVLPQPTTCSRDWHPIIHGPIQIHRLMLALLEAVRRGFLAGDEWVVSLTDPTGLATIGQDTQLSLLASIDHLWGNRVAPDLVQIQDGHATHTWRRDGLAYHPHQQAPLPPDVQIDLDLGLSPWHVLPPARDIPQVVVRDAVIPARVRIGRAEPAVRVAPLLDGVDLDDALTNILRSVFGLVDFRDGQLRAVREVVSGRDCVVLLPTGAGKSLIYQLAGLVLPGRTIIVDPLVSLMEDQERSLRSMGIDRAVVMSGFVTQSGNREAALSQVQSGDALFVFISPERLLDPNFRQRLKILTSTTPINLAVIDEAHCVSEWGHDFRVAYLNVGRSLRNFGSDQRGNPPPILALTGTASRAVLKDVLNDLDIAQRTADTLIKPATFDRPELEIEVVVDQPTNHEARLLGTIQTMPDYFGANPGRFFTKNSRPHAGIVFVPHVNGRFGIIAVSDMLSTQTGSEVVRYSGSAPKGWNNKDWELEKRRTAQRFMSDQNPLLVSTKAFGMGIDKPNVRYVVHYGAPGSIESYYQEIGRAGRDGRRARCVLIMAEADASRTTQLLADDTALSTLHEHVESRPKGGAGADCVDRNLFFHTKSFPGVSTEVAGVLQILDDLEPLNDSHQVELGFGADVAEREQAIHRLSLLGVVSDYTKSYGSKKFEIQVQGCSPDDVAQHLTTFIERAQPGRSAGMGERIRAAAHGKTRDAVEAAAQTLTEFIYDTVASARRRSLREVVLAAREGHRDPAQFRRRILDYLQEGEVAPMIERLVDDKDLSLHVWAEALADIESLTDAQEWRGSTARLLASYPNQPGLLLARGFSELLLLEGDETEAYSNISAAVRSARQNYALYDEDIFSALQLLVLNRLDGNRTDQALGLTLSVSSDLKDEQRESLMTAVRNARPEMPALAVLELNDILVDVVRICEEEISREVSA